MSSPELPRKPNGEPYQVLFHWDDESGEKTLALSPDGKPLVWVVGPHAADDVTQMRVEEAVPAISGLGEHWNRIRGKDESPDQGAESPPVY